jgi:hypothetical protein
VDDPYAVLELDAGASADDVRRAFKRLALEHHPDRNPGDPGAVARFRRVCEAFELLEGKSFRRRHGEPSTSTVWQASDPWGPFWGAPEVRHVPGTDVDDLHYPTAEEIASLDRPPAFRPLRALSFALVLVLLGAAAITVGYQATGTPVGPPDPHVEQLLEQPMYGAPMRR